MFQDSKYKDPYVLLFDSSIFPNLTTRMLYIRFDCLIVAEFRDPDVTCFGVLFGPEYKDPDFLCFMIPNIRTRMFYGLIALSFQI